MTNLTSDRLFNVTVDVVNADFEYMTGSKQFSTLWENYIPGNVTVSVNINKHFMRNSNNDSLVDATILWEPAFGMKCFLLIYFEYGKLLDAMLLSSIFLLFYFFNILLNLCFFLNRRYYMLL